MDKTHLADASLIFSSAIEAAAVLKTPRLQRELIEVEDVVLDDAGVRVPLRRLELRVRGVAPRLPRGAD
jgi:hypothetical protein